MPTYEQLKDSKIVLEQAQKFARTVDAALIKMSYFELLRTFLDLEMPNSTIRIQAGISCKELSKLYETHFREFVGFDSLASREKACLEQRANIALRQVIATLKTAGLSAAPLQKKHCSCIALTRYLLVEGNRVGLHVLTSAAYTQDAAPTRVNMKLKPHHFEGLAGIIVVIDVEGYEKDSYVFSTMKSLQELFHDGASVRHISFPLRPVVKRRNRKAVFDVSSYRDAWESLVEK